MNPVLVEIKGKVAHITLNRPDKYNAINRDMALALQAALETAEKNEAVRAVLLSGQGKAFSSGQDLTEITDPAGREMRRILPEQLNPIVKKLRTITRPVVCAVNGVATGASVSIALCCDIVVAAQSAYFVQAFSKIGLIPDSGGTYILPRLVGLQKASALMMLADQLSAEQADKIGMIYKCFPDDTLMDEAERIAKRLAEMPTQTLIYTRMALNESMNSTFEQQLDNKAGWQEKAAATDDFKEGIRAFMEKRAPRFSGK